MIACNSGLEPASKPILNFFPWLTISSTTGRIWLTLIGKTMKFFPLYSYSSAADLKHELIVSIRVSMMSGKRINIGTETSRSCNSSTNSRKSTEAQPSRGVTTTFPLSLIEK